MKKPNISLLLHFSFFVRFPSQQNNRETLKFAQRVYDKITLAVRTFSSFSRRSSSDIITLFSLLLDLESRTYSHRVLHKRLTRIVVDVNGSRSSQLTSMAIRVIVYLCTEPIKRTNGRIQKSRVRRRHIWTTSTIIFHRSAERLSTDSNFTFSSAYVCMLIRTNRVHRTTDELKANIHLRFFFFVNPSR